MCWLCACHAKPTPKHSFTVPQFREPIDTNANSFHLQVSHLFTMRASKVTQLLPPNSLRGQCSASAGKMGRLLLDGSISASWRKLERTIQAIKTNRSINDNMYSNAPLNAATREESMADGYVDEHGQSSPSESDTL